MKRVQWLALFGVLVWLGCRGPEGFHRSVVWHKEAPPITEPGDRFTVRTLELDAEGSAKDASQLAALHQAAEKAEDIFVFVHGWRRDARDLDTMRAFLRIYRGAFDCLSTRDEEGTRSCAILHAYCHPRNVASKLVVLVLWDAYSGPFGFRAIQSRAETIGKLGLYNQLARLHAELNGRGTLLVLGHSLGGAMLASALHRCAETGETPVDGAMLVVGAFEASRFNDLPPVPPSTGTRLFLMNLYNPHDGYLRLYRWFLGPRAAGEQGIDGIASVRGEDWAREGSSCQSPQVTTLGASMWEAASERRTASGSTMMMLNLDMDGLVNTHVDIEDLGAIRLYNRAATELIFQVLWSRFSTDRGMEPSGHG